MKGRRALFALACLCIFSGICLLLFPVLAQMENAAKNKETAQAYGKAVKKAENTEKMLTDASKFNESLAALKNPWQMPDKMRDGYYSLLDVSGDGMIGNVTVPKLSLSLPIYHGNEDTVLQQAAGHMEGSSLPVGGEGTHAVITGHTGMASAELFSGLDKLEKGDIFLINVLGKQMVYEVSKINTVLPEEMGYLKIQDGRDLVTLLTCTPPGVNSHRLLVTGERKTEGNGAKAAMDIIKKKREKSLQHLLFGLFLMASGSSGIFFLKKQEHGHT